MYQLIIDEEPIELQVNGQYVISEDSVLDVTKTTVSLEKKHGVYFVQFLSDAGPLRLEAKKKEVLFEFFERIRRYAIQSNFYELFEIKGDVAIDRATGVRHFYQSYPQNERYFQKIQTLKTLPQEFLQITDVFEELEHYFVIFEEAHKVEIKDHIELLYTLIHAQDYLRLQGYLLKPESVIVCGERRAIFAEYLEYSIVNEQLTIKNMMTKFAPALDLPLNLAELKQHPYFLESLDSEFIKRQYQSFITSDHVIEDQIDLQNGLVEVEDSQSSIDWLDESKLQKPSHKHNQSSRQFVLDSLFNEQILNWDQYNQFQMQEDESLTNLEKMLEKEIRYSPVQGSTCPSTSVMTHRCHAMEKLQDIMQQAKKLEMEVRNKNKVTSIRKSLMDLK